jgi:TonB-linked SusC/RagA family outer membrane protein
MEMEKVINDLKYCLFSNYWLKPLIVSKLCILFLIFQYESTFAMPEDATQQYTISGTVTDATTGEPLIGVSIAVKGTTIGMMSNIDGQFSLRVAESEVLLVFSYIGFTTREVMARAGVHLTVTLQEDLIALDEVIVVGYGVQQRESVVGAISQIGNEALLTSGTQNVTGAIAGRLSGVLTIQSTGEPGEGHSEIIIRGLSSWSGSAPLILVDGVERDFRFLDPNEIETISVLKDASATAVFGAKGANGVIIVTTRRGREQSPRLSFTGSTGMQIASGIPGHIDSYTTMSMLNVARMNDMQYSNMLDNNILEQYRNPSSRLNSLRYPNVNWFDEVTRPFAPTSNANLNIRGGTRDVKYFASLGYQQEGNFFIGMKDGHTDSNFKNDRFNYRANMDFNLTSSTALAFNLGGDVTVHNRPQTAWSIWDTMWGTGPARFPVKFPEWVVEEDVPDPHYPDAKGVRLAAAFGERHGNPYTNFMDGSFRNFTRSRVFTDLILGQKLDFIIPGLSAGGKVSLSTYNNMLTKYSNSREPQYYLHYDRIGTDQNPWERIDETMQVYNKPPINIQIGGLQNDFYTDLYYEATLNYANSFGGGQHNVSGLALFNRQQKNDVLEFPYYNQAWVGRATYNYNLKYLAEFNLGYTGSERFAPGNRYGLFPSGAIGWVISEESFFKDAVPWVNNLKLRYSQGLVGSDYAESRWLYISEFYTVGNLIREDIGANLHAQWEEARKRDIGLEVAILDNMFRFTVDVYDEYRSHMLLEPQNVTFLVGTSFKDLNLGELKKQGFEIEAEFNRRSENFRYYLRGMFGYNENRIVYKDDLRYAPNYRKQEGKALGMPEGWRTPGAAGVLTINTGYHTSVDDIHNHALQMPPNGVSVGDHMFLDYDVDRAVTSRDKYPIDGSEYPPITYSFASGMEYKGWRLNIMFQGNHGKWVIFNNNFQNEFLMGNYSVKQTQLNYWRPDRQAEANHATLHYFDGGGGIPQYAWAGGAALEGYDIRTPGHFWRKADYLRLKDVNLEYTFTPDMLQRAAGVSSMTVYAQGHNLLTFTDLVLGDPERKDFTRGFYPLMKSVRLGLKANF